MRSSLPGIVRNRHSQSGLKVVLKFFMYASDKYLMLLKVVERK